MNRSDNHQSALIGTPQPVLLATDARTATATSACQICARPTTRGARIATLVTGGDVHIGCIAPWAA